MLEENKLTHVKVWSKTKKGPSPGCTECVISSHGAIPFINWPAFWIKGVTLVFYAPHGQSVKVSLEDVITGSVKAEPTIKSGKGQDYELSKFQGAKRGAKGETYEIIRTQDDTLAGKFTDKEMENLANLYVGHEKYMERYKKWMDVVTIRNRKFHSSNVMLSAVLKELHDNGYKYTTVHCSFCRCKPGYTGEAYNPPSIPI
jgi:hypothetical protein